MKCECPRDPETGAFTGTDICAPCIEYAASQSYFNLSKRITDYNERVEKLDEEAIGQTIEDKLSEYVKEDDLEGLLEDKFNDCIAKDDLETEIERCIEHNFEFLTKDDLRDELGEYVEKDDLGDEVGEVLKDTELVGHLVAGITKSAMNNLNNYVTKDEYNQLLRRMESLLDNAGELIRRVEAVEVVQRRRGLFGSLRYTFTGR